MQSRFAALTFACVASLPAVDLPDGAVLVQQSLRIAELQGVQSESDMIVEIDVPGGKRIHSLSPHQQIIHGRDGERRESVQRYGDHARGVREALPRGFWVCASGISRSALRDKELRIVPRHPEEKK